MKIIESPIHYMGNKYKLMPILKELFPNKINKLYDVFGGSGTVTVNTNANIYIYNELNPNIYNLFNMLIDNSDLEIINHIDNNINTFNLEKGNKETYLKFREYYNTSMNIKDLFTITFYGFCNLIRFNQKGQFNMPVGNCHFTNRHKELIKEWKSQLNSKTIETYNIDYKNILQIAMDNVEENDFVYLDPPYLNTTAIYNEQRAFGGWNINNDLEMLEMLDKINDKGIKFAMSNVKEHNGISNNHLIEWANKNNYNIIDIEKTYCSLGKGNKNSKEILITNYRIVEKIEE